MALRPLRRKLIFLVLQTAVTLHRIRLHQSHGSLICLKTYQHIFLFPGLKSNVIQFPAAIAFYRLDIRAVQFVGTSLSPLLLRHLCVEIIQVKQNQITDFRLGVILASV